MAAINFPDPNVTNPETGNPYKDGWYNASNGVTYVYTNGVWRAASSEQSFEDIFVNKSGDTMTGSLVINNGELTVEQAAKARNLFTVNSLSDTIPDLPAFQAWASQADFDASNPPTSQISSDGTAVFNTNVESTVFSGNQDSGSSAVFRGRVGVPGAAGGGYTSIIYGDGSAKFGDNTDYVQIDPITNGLFVVNGGVTSINLNKDGSAAFNTVSLGANSTTNNLLSIGRETTGGYISFNLNGANFGFMGSSDVLYTGGTNVDLGIRAENKLRVLTNGANLQLTINDSGVIYSVPTNNDTTANAANVYVASNGRLSRSTSSIKYKTDVETLEDSYADAILNCRPVWYRSTCDVDNPEHGWWGFIAEEVAEIDPRLVQWKTVEVIDDVETPCDPEPKGVAYDRFVPHLVNLVKRQQQAIEALQEEVRTLKGE